VTIKRDINKLIPPKARGKKRLAPLGGNRSIAASRGVGKLSSGTSASGIASPLTEVAGQRAYHTTIRSIRSSDGLFVLAYYNLKSIRFLDAKSRTVIFNYDDPA
jgi:hypothetical protein